MTDVVPPESVDTYLSLALAGNSDVRPVSSWISSTMPPHRPR